MSHSIDPKNPDSNYCLATNHLRVPFNMVTFNDGYHITHHVNSHCHWASMPHHFITHIDQYEAGGAICFEGINFLEVRPRETVAPRWWASRGWGAALGRGPRAAARLGR